MNEGSGYSSSSTILRARGKEDPGSSTSWRSAITWRYLAYDQPVIGLALASPRQGAGPFPALPPSLLPAHGDILLQSHVRCSLSPHFICVQVLKSGGNNQLPHLPSPSGD